MTQRTRLLLDTQVFLWWRLDDPRLSADAREAIATARLVLVSAASAWEAAIKRRLGRLSMDVDFASGVKESRFERLSIGFEHAAETGRMAHFHRDPFDRMLIAQARVERLTLVTHDRLFAPYEVDLVWA